ncbi:MAG: [protein-PII] uridylyltransferase [Deltaproteobacteria bacterium]|nr:[protein-PII] uridylyltransferase [Deltaproteobacteria bacterium]
MSEGISPVVDLGGLAPKLGKTCSGYLGGYRRAFEDAVRRGDPGVVTARSHARALDGLLSALYCASDAATRSLGQNPHGRVGLVAVGGYGRSTLGLNSDVDVVFLCDDSSDPFVGALAEGLLYPLWDLGVDIGHAVRSVDETLSLAREDIRTATTLIDFRRIAGSGSLLDDLERGAREQVFEPHLVEFLAALEHDTESRHRRFGGSLYLIEPDVKQGPGGLRDMDVAEWAARARWGARNEQDYVRTGALLAREVRELEDAREMLWRVRNLLHLRAGRQQDRLTFGDQEDIAQELGFVDGLTLGVEQFMQAYYRHARIVALTAERMLDRARPRSKGRAATFRKLAHGIFLADGVISLENPQRLESDPALAFRFYRQALKHQKRPDHSARDAIARTAPDKRWRLRLQDSEEANQLFLSALRNVDEAPFRTGSTVAEFHDVGLVSAMIPEFEPLVGRVNHDVFHVYTADIHAVKALEYLQALMRGESRVSSFAARLAAEAPRRLPVFLAVLLHSLGRVRGKEQEARGARLAESVALRLGFSAMDAQHIAWLVREQKSLYRWATQRDIHDPQGLSEVVRMVKTPERLRDLFLCTVAVVSTVNPKAMTSWKARALDDVYLATLAELESGDTPIQAESRVLEVKLQAIVGFAGDAGQEELHDFIDEMPDRYFLGNPVDVVRRHARIARSRDPGLVTVRVGPGPSDDVEEVVVVSSDRSGLLADLTAVFAAHDLSVLSAQIYTRQRPSGNEAFDVFWVKIAEHTPMPARLAQELQQDITHRVTNRISAEDLIARQSTPPPWSMRPGPEVPTHISVDNNASAKYTVVDVFTRDRAGLLHEIARTLHELDLSIAVSKVNTEGQSVADVFYVADADGKKLQDPERLKHLQRVLYDRVLALHARAETQ